MTVTFDSNILLSYYQSRAGIGGALVGATGPAKTPTPKAPWTAQPETPAEASEAVKAALGGKKLVDEDGAQLSVAGASADYKKLFALYKGLQTLTDIVNQYGAKNQTALEKSRLSATFDKGLAEIAGYVDTAQFEQMRMVQGAANTTAKATLTVPKAVTKYVTDPLTTSTSAEVPAFQGDVQFNISIKRVNQTYDIPIDLNGMGGQPRSLANVINFINDQIAATGVATRFGTEKIPGQAREIKVGGKTVTLPPASDQWAMKVTVGTSETVTFSAPATAGAVYVAQSVGDPDPDRNSATNDGVTQRQLLKFQTDNDQLAAPPQPTGEANWVDGRVFAQDLDKSVKTIHAQTVGPDGSVYMLADVTDATGGQEIKGTQDVALLKYDSAGKLIYTRTLGAAGSATGLGLAVSADGKVAIAGSVKGALGGAQEGPLISGTTGAYAGVADSFVTVFNADGEEQWTERRGARQDDEASQVAFGADGTVYVAGRAKSAVAGGGGAIGGWDNYLQAFKQDPLTKKVATVFTQTFGTTGADRPEGLVVDGDALVTASVEDGHAILRRFDISGGAPSLVETRDIGDLQGGDIAGLALDGANIVLAGTSANAGLDGGVVTRGYSGGLDAFAMRLSATLTPGGGDRTAFYGGAGDDKATSLAVGGGKVWIGGSAGSDLPGLDPVGKKDGFLANLDLDTGLVDWSRRFSGKDGQAAPSAIAIDTQGSSALDRLGLPTGVLDTSPSQLITAASALRAGDQFTIKAGIGGEKTVTIDANDTLDTLATKIRRAASFQAKVTVSTVGGARTLKIEPISSRAIIEIAPGKTDKDALEMLGIPEGVVRATQMNKAGKMVPADGKEMLYGLSLDSGLNLSSPEQIRHALAVLSTAQGVIRSAYKDLVAAANPQSAAQAGANANGPVPAYLTNQISNYQAALDRLTGGSDQGSGPSGAALLGF